ncbi:hypothetical protein AF72_11720 [Xylella taiwanensis]|uniref:Uncharacterized protein n=1 Tax=Xylella taiwanensis TaxID=1444770 RepID=Z9JHQ8_9GAMM|nr:hypothetical protein AF72_11720 [Xylella taiwanensis]
MDADCSIVGASTKHVLLFKATWQLIFMDKFQYDNNVTVLVTMKNSNQSKNITLQFYEL